MYPRKTFPYVLGLLVLLAPPNIANASATKKNTEGVREFQPRVVL
jgi:hypothetical protein